MLIPLFTGDHIKPTVTMTAPSGTIAGTVTVSATASDNYGVTSVQFKADGSNIGSPVTMAPFQISYDTRPLTDGSHTFTAVASDAAGNTQTSAGQNATTANNITFLSSGAGASGPPASASFTSTPAGALIVVGVFVSGGHISAAPTDNQSNGYTLVASVSTPDGFLYMYYAHGVAAGTTSVSASSSDNTGNVCVVATTYSRASTINNNSGGSNWSHTTYSGPTFSYAVSREIAVVVDLARYDGGANGPQTTPNSPFTRRVGSNDNDFTGATVEISDAITSTGGSGITVGGTTNNNADVWGMLASFEGI